MNLYEGMYIFPESMEEDAIADALKDVGKEIEKSGGTVKSTARIGKRKFARQMKKQDHGYYVVMTFELPPAEVEPLRKRFNMNEDLMRAQIVCAESELVDVPSSSNDDKEDKNG